MLFQNILDWFSGNAVLKCGSMKGEHLSITDWIWMWLKKENQIISHGKTQVTIDEALLA